MFVVIKLTSSAIIKRLSFLANFMMASMLLLVNTWPAKMNNIRTVRLSCTIKVYLQSLIQVKCICNILFSQLKLRKHYGVCVCVCVCRCRCVDFAPAKSGHLLPLICCQFCPPPLICQFWYTY